MFRRTRRWLIRKIIPVATIPEQWLRQKLRYRGTRQPRLLFIDMRLPLPWYGAGFSRANAILRVFHNAGWRIVCYPISKEAVPANVIRADIPPSVKILKGGNLDRLIRYFLGRVFAHDLILISRRPAIESVGGLVRWVKTRNPECKIIFDFEALPPLGPRSLPTLGRGTTTRSDADDLIRAQIADISWVDAVVCNSMGDAEELRLLGCQGATAVNYLDITAPTTTDFSQRRDMLFVGRVVEEDSPNVDGLCWFICDVWPKIIARLGSNVRLLVAGLVTSPAILNLKSESVEFVGVVHDLRELYDRTKVFVAANRVSFGVPIKVLEAAAYGLPVVTTNEVNSYLRWNNGTEILCDDAAAGFADACIRLHEDPVLWRQIRDQALEKVDAEGNRRRLLDLVNRLVPRLDGYGGFASAYPEKASNRFLAKLG